MKPAAANPSLWPTVRKLYHPRLRRPAPVGIKRNGGRVRVYACICGAQISMCATWPKTARVRRFEAEHNKTCVCHGLTEAEIARAAAAAEVK